MGVSLREAVGTVKRPEHYPGEAKAIAILAAIAAGMFVVCSHLAVLLLVGGHTNWVLLCLFWAWFWGLFLKMCWRDSEGRL